MNKQQQGTNQCVICGRPVVDMGYLCHSDTNNCTTLAAGHLDMIASCWRDLDVTITRRDKLTDGTGRSNEAPLPFNEEAAEAAREIRTAILGLARTIQSTRGLDLTADPMRRPLMTASPGTNTELIAAARYIRSHLRWLRCQDIAADAYRTIEDAARTLARTIDTHPTLTDLGPCGNLAADGCDGRLLAAHGARMVRCYACGWVASVAETVDTLMDWARDQLMTVDEIAPLLSKRRRDGRRVPRGTVGAWAARGLLPRKGREGAAFLYSLGDAIDLADRLLPDDTPAPTTEQELAA